MTPPSIQKFDLEDMEKLVAIVAVSEMMQEYLIKIRVRSTDIGLVELILIPEDTELLLSYVHKW